MWTEWQSWVLSLTDKGAGLSAAPGDMTVKQRKECDALVAAGCLRKTTNHSQDIYGMYIKDEQSGSKPSC